MDREFEKLADSYIQGDFILEQKTEVSQLAYEVAPDFKAHPPAELEVYIASATPFIFGLNYLVSFYTLRKMSKRRIDLFFQLSKKTFLDSGLLSLHDREELLEFLDLQEEALRVADRYGFDRVTMFDVPTIPALVERLRMNYSQLFDLHLKMSEKFKDLKTERAKKVWSIQGTDTFMTLENIKAIKDWVKEGDVIALGGLPHRQLEHVVARYAEETLEAIRAAFPGHKIHLFGVVAPRLVAYLYLKGLIDSVDAVSQSVYGEYSDCFFSFTRLSPIDFSFGYRFPSLRAYPAFFALSVGAIFYCIQKEITYFRNVGLFKKEVSYED